MRKMGSINPLTKTTDAVSIDIRGNKRRRKNKNEGGRRLRVITAKYDKAKKKERKYGKMDFFWY